MRIKKVRVQGFRLLRDVELMLEDTATVVVGRNNSGKTSLTDVFRCFGSSGSSFRLQDFSAADRTKFAAARNARLAGAAPQDVLAMLPTIAVTITMSYDKAAPDIGPMSSFMIDLDPNSDIAIAHIIYAPRLSYLSNLLDFEADTEASEPEVDFYRHIKEMIGSAYEIEVWAIDPTAPKNRRRLDTQHLNALIKWDLVRAQRTLDHFSHGDAEVIGKLLGSLYKTAKAPTAAAADQLLAAQLKSSVEGIERGVQKDFDAVLTGLLPAMDVLGFPGPNDTKLRPETVLNVEALLNDHTKVVYASDDGVHLPEGYNGLGTRNLIYMLLQLQSFHKEYRARETRPNTHLIFIEEPEAHLHPQMQEVFIAQLHKAVAKLSEEYPDEPAWKVQFVITTHSPHVANAATFEAVRYFLNADPVAGARQTKVKDFKKGMATIPPADKEFLHQYMTLTKCDLYFADKAIMVEGTTERILLPKLRDLVDLELPSEHKLARQYVTTMEVGGAYAHLFYPLIDFLELKTLVITDIDSVRAVATKTKAGMDTTKYKKCLVVDGERTSNLAIRHWFNTNFSSNPPHIKPLDLLTKADEEKTSGVRRLAYQIPEVKGTDVCARSFEDALVLANPKRFELEDDGSMASDAWEMAKDMGKADTALQFAIREKDWTAPRYIREGLAWLAEPPPPASGLPPIQPPDTDSKLPEVTP
ncbi:ATP-dependent endonuclease [Cereibacter sphaeroides]|uniref:ATP-dependent endonuclease n=1 Tax=Cereibacter sphaeroides TaxID=1063 RepID=A0AAX1UG85_CERSP|nr:ATP-dependent endonuclease [Cereibacter sphaeroides]RHZ91564.1 ATP-dependent endonuclease [Cereibacter sphaeroides]